jgi:hypothetical protein
MPQQTSGSGSHLPANRAFVVQFAAELTAEDPFHGRAEHLASGDVIHFESLSHLAEFVARILGAAAGTE